MKNKKRSLVGTLVAFAWLMLAGASYVVLAPAPSHAQAFHSGNTEVGLCTCPTDFGNCLCKIAR